MTSSCNLALVRIDSRPLTLAAMIRDLVAYRRLLLLFSWRDILLRYKQTTVGILWVVLQPLLMMVVFSVFFSGTMPADGLPYPLFVYSGLTIWQLFAKILSQTTVTLKEHESIVGRVYFPRALLFCSVVVVALVDFAVSLVVMVPMFFFYHLVPTGRIWMLPAFSLMAVLSALSVGVWLAMLDVVYRDVRQTLPVILQALMFCAPVFYASTLVAPSWRFLYTLNPMTVALNGLRWALLPGTQPPDWFGGAISLAFVLLLLAAGLVVFSRREGNLIDHL